VYLKETIVYNDETLPKIFSETMFWKLYLFLQYHVTKEFKIMDNIQNNSGIHLTHNWQKHIMICLPCFCQSWQSSEMSCLSLRGHRGINRCHITQVELSYKMYIINNILKTKAYW